MANEVFDQEVAQMLKGVKLARPAKESMATFLSGVQHRIDVGVPGGGVGFLLPAASAALLLAAAGAFAFYFFVMKPSQVSTVTTPTAVVAPQPIQVPMPVAEKAVLPEVLPEAVETLSIADELMILESLDLTEGLADLMAGEDLLEEMFLLDEMELSLLTTESTTPVMG